MPRRNRRIRSVFERSRIDAGDVHLLQLLHPAQDVVQCAITSASLLAMRAAMWRTVAVSTDMVSLKCSLQGPEGRLIPRLHRAIERHDVVAQTCCLCTFGMTALFIGSMERRSRPPPAIPVSSTSSRAAAACCSTAGRRPRASTPRQKSSPKTAVCCRASGGTVAVSTDRSAVSLPPGHRHRGHQPRAQAHGHPAHPRLLASRPAVFQRQCLRACAIAVGPELARRSSARRPAGRNHSTMLVQA